MYSTNMLNVKNVRLHGMSSRRWQTKDKLIQYRAILYLNRRDKKIRTSDTIKAKEQNKKTISHLTTNINRERLQLAIIKKGSRQMIRNVFADYKEMQLAYQDLPPRKVIEMMKQKNFKRRKELDRVSYEINKKKDKLIGMKLECVELEDRITFESKIKEPLKDEIQATIVRIQEAILKRDAALIIRKTYRKIIDIIKKDRMYYDAVLNTLKHDGYNQGLCIHKVIEMGQYATEYSADTRFECRLLEIDVMSLLKERQQNIKDVKNDIKAIHSTIRTFFSHDDYTLGVARSQEIKNNNDFETLQEESNDVLQKLNEISSQTFASNIENILPRMQHQKHQQERLSEMVVVNTQWRNALLKKSRHVEEMFNNYMHSMVETTTWYRKKKMELNKETMGQIQEQHNTEKQISYVLQLYESIRIALQNIAEVLRNVSDPKTKKQSQTKLKKGRAKKIEFVNTEIVKPEPLEEDTFKLIDQIKYKIKLLLNYGYPDMDGETLDKAAGLYKDFVGNMTGKVIVFEKEPTDQSLIQDIQKDDVYVPTRSELKRISLRILMKFRSQEEKLGISLKYSRKNT